VSISGLVFVSLLVVRESGAVFFLPTVEQGKAKPKQMHITFDSQLKTPLFWTKF